MKEHTIDKMTIRLMIGRQVYRLKIHPEEEEIFRRAAKLINEKLAKYEQRWEGGSDIQNLAISALDFAVVALRLEQRQDTTPFVESIKELTAEIENTLKQA